jgi:hypothetical protein
MARALARVGPGAPLAILGRKKFFPAPFPLALTFPPSRGKSKILLAGESLLRPSLPPTGKIGLVIHFHFLSRPQIEFAIPFYFNYGLTSTSGHHSGSLVRPMGSCNTGLSPLKVNQISHFLNSFNK